MTKNKFTLKREEREVVNERIFDAPRELVWKVYTDPELVPKWWGPKYLMGTGRADVGSPAVGSGSGPARRNWCSSAADRAGKL